MSVQNIHIDGKIGAADFFDLGESVDLFKVRNMVAELPADTSELNVYINSGGGSVNEGFAIHDYITDLPYTINTIVNGMCGSIATIVAQSAKNAKKKGTRKMYQNSEYFIHNPYWMPSAPDAMDAEALQRLTDELKKNEERIISFYVLATGADRQLIADKMKASTSLTASEAMDMGFIDDIINTNITAAHKYKLVAFLDKEFYSQKTINEMDANKIQASMSKIELLMSKLFKKQLLNLMVETDKGNLYFDGELAVDTLVFSDDAMTVLAIDGDYTYESTVVTVVAGAVTAIKQIPTIADLIKERDALQAQVAELTQANAATIEAVNAINAEFLALKSSVAGSKQPLPSGAQAFKGEHTMDNRSIGQRILDMRKAKAETSK